MYIRFHSPRTNQIELRDVRHFAIRSAGNVRMENGSTIECFSLCDATFEILEMYGNEVIQSLSSFLLGGEQKVDSALESKRVIQVGDNEGSSVSDFSELGIFDSYEIACGLLNEICEAMKAGKTYFDLASYGSNGKPL